MSTIYNKNIDEKWQQIWQQNHLYSFDKNSNKPKLYLLEMFSYPSASKLHLGHWWNYSLPDTYGRMKRMQGFNLFHPVGFDAFGLPAENYAIKTSTHPKVSTAANIEQMENQLKKIGTTYDWDYEIKTNEEEYYKWTQWLFLKLYEKGLAYRKEAPVNYCPTCQTVLANEQASGGECERCHSVVVHKNLTQWFFKITDYAEELITGLDNLDWPEKTKRIQTNWIGKSTGTEIYFNLQDKPERIKVFTTRADTLMGLSYIVIAPEYHEIDKLTTAQQEKCVKEYIENAAKQTEIERLSITKEKTGVFTGSYAIHPLTNKKIPIWVSDYVIASYGTGAVMAVPAHDERDFAFAQKYNLPVTEVIKNPTETAALPFVEDGVLVNSEKYNNMTSSQAKIAITEDLVKINMGKHCTNYRLRDWLVSRQRYWGAPIPIVYCPCCGTVPVKECDLPVKLPYDVQFKPTGKSPLAYCDSFINTTCPNCGEKAVRETDTLDTFVCSSWYYLRYLDPHNSKMPWNKDITDKFMSVDKYIGGVEHASMHLLYARFITKAMRDMGYLSQNEPFLSLVHQGMILGKDGQKMSKSAGNTIMADDYVSKYGSDVFRMYLAFGFSYTDGGPWSDDGVAAIDKFFKKIAKLFNTFMQLSPNANGADSNELETIRHRTIKAVTNDIDNFQFNTAVARIMELTSAINKYQQNLNRNYTFEKDVIEDYAKLLSVFAPHYMEEVWQELAHENSIFNEKWPTYDEAKTLFKNIEIVIQINGTIRARIEIESGTEPEKMQTLALQNKVISDYIKNSTIKKVIAIKDKLVNIVI